MANLWVTTFIWAFSFPIIGYYIVGVVDNYFAILFRSCIAFLIFLPFLNLKLKFDLKLKLITIGGLQIGLMSIFYYHSFLYLSVSEVALFTIFTPFYLSLIYDLISFKFKKLYLISITLCIIGAFIIKFESWSLSSLYGFILVQMANICFGAAQAFYKLTCKNLKDNRSNFGYFYLGAVLVSVVSFILFGNFTMLPQNLQSWVVLLYLGVVASGFGYYLWSSGSLMVDSGTLAIMNNAIIPIAILVNAIFWGVDFDIYKMTIGGFLIVLALFLQSKFETFYKNQINFKYNT
ncbi:EamA family transporter [Campylobacter devanensis]|uniref:EamA family transporter n=1 Tax=Campylobacter devanensis TaxID=3161138 RepID=UPI000A32CE22|nr:MULTISPECIES: EamA family transporter [unclassified Campylobacter]